PQRGYLYITLTTGTLSALEFGNTGWRLFGEIVFMFSASSLLYLLLAPALLLYVRQRLSVLTKFLELPGSSAVRLRFRDEIAELCTKIQDTAAGSTRDLEQRDRLRQERQSLLFDIVHDLRGPLSGIHAAIEILFRDSTSIPARTLQALLKSLRVGLSTQR